MIYTLTHCCSPIVEKPLHQRLTTNIIATIWYLKTSRKSSTANIRRRKESTRKSKIASLACPYCDLPIDYFRSPPPDYDPPNHQTKDKRSRSRSRSPKPGSPQSPRYSPTGDASSSSSSSSSDEIPPPPKMPPHSTHVALLNLNDNDNINDLQLQHLDIRKLLKTTDTARTRYRRFILITRFYPRICIIG
jgi:hypothetical protein